MAVKILVKDSTGEIKHQGGTYIFYSDKVKIDEHTYICDLNENTSSEYEIDNEITDFVGNKFLYEDGEVVSNPYWIDPEGE